jgi:hypothetical protein
MFVLVWMVWRCNASDARRRLTGPPLKASLTGKLFAFGGVLHESSPTCATHEALVERREHGQHDAVLPLPVHDRPDLQGDP